MGGDLDSLHLFFNIVGWGGVGLHLLISIRSFLPIVGKHKISPSLKRGDMISLSPRWAIQGYKVPSKYTKKFLKMLLQ
jgi:hypothetical protein